MQHLNPIVVNQTGVDACAENGLECGIVSGLLDRIELEFVEPTNARCKPKSEQMTKRKDVVGESFGIGGVLVNVELGIVVQQAIEHVGGFANTSRDDLRVEGRMLIGHVGVEGDARFLSIIGVA